ncbi:K(+)-transporting ATPase subunit C [Nocardioides ultimimeridianus]
MTTRPWLAQTVAGLRMLVVLTVLLGIGYPLAMTGVGQALFHRHANGSLVTRDGSVVGSSLIGQASTARRYFWSRPSEAGTGYDPMSSGGSNLSPDNPTLVATVRERIAAVAKADGIAPADVAPDAVLASGSGLDPHISPEYAEEQVARVAAARHLPVAAVRRLVADHTSGRMLGFLGEPTVNVLLLNLALDDLAATTAAQQ